MSVKKHASLCLEVGWSHDHKVFLFDLLVYFLKEEKKSKRSLSLSDCPKKGVGNGNSCIILQNDLKPHGCSCESRYSKNKSVLTLHGLVHASMHCHFILIPLERY